MTEPKLSDEQLNEIWAEVIACETSRSTVPLSEMVATVTAVELRALLHRLGCAEKLIYAKDVFHNKPSTTTEKWLEEAEAAWDASKRSE